MLERSILSHLLLHTIPSIPKATSELQPALTLQSMLPYILLTANQKAYHQTHFDQTKVGRQAPDF